MLHHLPNICLLCSGALEVTETTCLDCGIQMRGHFAPAPYRQLDSEQLRFLETFLRCRGVIRDMEAVLGLSYPTVRARLDTLLAALGFDDAAVPPSPLTLTAEQIAARRKEILEAIQTGALNAESGLQALQELSLPTTP